MKRRVFFVLSGIFLIIGGIWALLAPVAASLAAVLYVGAAFAAAGVLHVIAAFRETEDRVWNAVFGLVGIALGLSFFVNPFGGMISITLVLGAFFLVSGLMQLYMAWKRRATDSVWMMALSGVLSVGLAVLIAFNVFAASATLPGIVLAIELITTGVALLMLRPRSDATGASGGEAEAR